MLQSWHNLKDWFSGKQMDDTWTCCSLFLFKNRGSFLSFDIFTIYIFIQQNILGDLKNVCIWSQMLAVTALQLNNITLANNYLISYFNLYIIIISQYSEQKNAYRNRCFQLCAFHLFIHSYILVVNKLTCSKHFNWKSEANRKHFNLKQHYTFQFSKCWA